MSGERIEPGQLEPGQAIHLRAQGELPAAGATLTEMVTVPAADWSALLAVATLYVSAFTDDEAMTLPERLRLQEVEDILGRHGRRY